MGWLDSVLHRTVVRLRPNERAAVFLNIKDGYDTDAVFMTEMRREIDAELERVGLTDRIAVFALSGMECPRVVKSLVKQKGQ